MQLFYLQLEASCLQWSVFTYSCAWEFFYLQLERFYLELQLLLTSQVFCLQWDSGKVHLISTLTDCKQSVPVERVCFSVLDFTANLPELALLPGSCQGKTLSKPLHKGLLELDKGQLVVRVGRGDLVVWRGDAGCLGTWGPLRNKTTSDILRQNNAWM